MKILGTIENLSLSEEIHRAGLKYYDSIKEYAWGKLLDK